MTAASSDVLQILRTHESKLRLRGVSHAAVFGSVARGEAGAGSDIDGMGWNSMNIGRWESLSTPG